MKPEREIGAIFNCGAAEYKGGTKLLPRVIKKGYAPKKNGYGYENYISEIWLAEGDGKEFTLSNGPFIKPDKPYDRYGCEDARVTELGGEYLITYTALSSPAFSGKGNRIGLASTKDFSTLEKHGIIGPHVNDKDAVIFPEEINGNIGLLHRIDPNIQIMYFDDIEQLKQNHDKNFLKKYNEELNKHIVLDRKYEWESKKIGAGAPPIKTKEGWLLIYHGVDKNKIYRAGAALLDLDDPQQVIARSSEPILEPEMDYEKNGDIPNVIFPEGAIVKNGVLNIYYGAADRYCCLATCKLNNLIDFLFD
ncbi:MAG: glycosidase [Candidatus Aenigmarchaeota archaeon]|nr:glycosidase [Candidatus Aenigmarchaeota archaeon]